MSIETRVITATDGRRVRVHDAGSRGSAIALPVFWHHGTPGIGEPPQPLLAIADELCLRLIGHDRPGYGDSDRLQGRCVGHAAADVADIADALGIVRYAVMGYSGGGPHALACAAADPRVTAAATLAGLAPRDVQGLDWFDGMIDSGIKALTSAERGESARRAAEDDGYDPEFTDRDLAALDGSWEWLGRIASSFSPADLDGAIDDDLSYVNDWDVDLDAIDAPVRIWHGDADRIVPPAHGRWLSRRLRAELRSVPGAGHVSVLEEAGDALRWIAAASR
ncbi:alpha/beta fold hydrolase [uncultured Demequina sp.]|uniref:alpha/beta fold hydrolase n=1 Tax=uncultured Demequina sp. TaxID=693499 RepID=UPI0025F4A7C2|nr:alpha/beta hydrolase [uncultured Demequina sp.]